MLAAATCAVLSASAYDPITSLGVQSEVEPGVWSSSFSAAKEYAENNNVPLIVVWANPGCGQCELLEKACAKSDFVAWRQERKYIMVFAYGQSSADGKAAYSWIRSVQKIGSFPFLGFYWENNKSGAKIETVMVGRTGKMTVKSGTLQEQFMSTADQLFAGWTPGEDPDPDPDPDPVHTHTWDAGTVTTPASCTAAGVKTYSCDCGQTKTETIPALGHDWSEWVVDEAAGTKTRTCSRCDASETVDLREEVNPATLFKKATTLDVNALAYNGDTIFGKVAVTLAKYNAKKGVKVTVKISSIAGKTYSAYKYVVPNKYGDLLDFSLPFKSPIGAMPFEIEYRDGAFNLLGANDNYSIEVGDVTIGGNLENDSVSFAAELVDDIELPDGYDFLIDLPAGIEATIKSGYKFNFGSSKAPAYQKYREDGETWYELKEYDEEKYPNANAVKITYKPKTGVFSGSFKFYATNTDSIASNKKPTIKTYTVKVSGVVIDGVGTGTGTVKIGKTTYTVNCSFE